MNITIVDLNSLTAFWLIFTRWMATVFQLPVFDRENVPPLVKVLFCLVITYAFFPKLEPIFLREMLLFNNNFMLLTIFHTMIGLIIGYLAKMIFQIFVASGQLITAQLGLTTASTFDPTFGAPISAVETLIHWVMIILIFLSGALLPFFKGPYNAFFTIGLEQVARISQAPAFFVDFFANIFSTALLLASPFIFVNTTISLILGMLGRAVPQINILMMSMVVNVGLGLITFLLVSPEFFNRGLEVYIENLGLWFNFIK